MNFAVIISFSALALAQTPGTVAPRVLSSPQPSYSEEALRAKINATVTLAFIVSADGVPESIQVARPAGFGLDERAVQAVSTWRFEPATKEGVKVSLPATVVVTFRLLRMEGNARLNFTPTSGQARPEFLSGKMPPSPKEGESLRMSLLVGPDGRTRDISVLETNSPKLANEAARVMKDWRFRPASASGASVEAKGVFELGRPDPNVSTKSSNPSLPVTPQALSSASSPTDGTLPAPKLISPYDGAVFDGIPRRTICRWEPSPGAASYLFEWDFSSDGVWDSVAKNRLGMGFLVQGTEYSFDFVGAQPGRWRVWPISATGQRGTPSEWRGFRYLH